MRFQYVKNKDTNKFRIHNSKFTIFNSTNEFTIMNYEL